MEGDVHVNLQKSDETAKTQVVIKDFVDGVERQYKFYGFARHANDAGVSGQVQ